MPANHKAIMSDLAKSLRNEAERQRFQGPRPLLERAAEFVEAFARFYPNCGQLIDGFIANSPGDQWTEWDKSVREELIALGKQAGLR